MTLRFPAPRPRARDRERGARCPVGLVGLGQAVALVAAAGSTFADDRAASASAPLPPLAAASRAGPNPYRGDTRVLAVGEARFQANCARCHGDAASQPSAEAPDLRRLDGFCRRLKEPGLASRCLGDVDDYFLFSVREGKVRAGVVHMPPWKDVLPPEDIWAIRTFIESRPPEPPRTTTSVDAARAAEAARAASRP